MDDRAPHLDNSPDPPVHNSSYFWLSANRFRRNPGVSLAANQKLEEL